jgi:hypothetical protein
MVNETFTFSANNTLIDPRRIRSCALMLRKVTKILKRGMIATLWTTTLLAIAAWPYSYWRPTTLVTWEVGDQGTRQFWYTVAGGRLGYATSVRQQRIGTRAPNWGIRYPKGNALPPAWGYGTSSSYANGSARWTFLGLSYKRTRSASDNATNLYIPVSWIAGLTSITSLLSMMRIVRRARRTRRSRAGCCAACGYDLYGLVSSTNCPECGTPLPKTLFSAPAIKA